jgi:CRISPR/Cas system-associated protein Csm6
LTGDGGGVIGGVVALVEAVGDETLRMSTAAMVYVYAVFGVRPESIRLVAEAIGC